VSFARAFALFWWNFVVGDEWRVAVIVGAAAVVGALAAANRWAGGEVVALALGAGVMLVVSGVIVASGRRRKAGPDG
jgi:hypothetical protein